ncbi:MAG: outer membrane protein assembly factor BamA [Rickettsiales bacterium]|nr:outer membrane protein assembly factor BamA [Pseudomonadota bacterium]MDA0966505.1 outer membrane protein assembly factor BamA [Pseudomonadota bacterium]MDG4543367.1 outer membrane protein assembly factor BamA [Rickettsiales bacterium]MDG4545633.1 outer membrane protein assembly factor BamA [Rickettsiales bacterium]MDG4548082.1 outer membrane protein assembly factor BamA [Rickettsiales bacterium]
MSFISKIFLFFSLIITLIASVASAQEGVIREVVIKGNQRVEKETIKSYMDADVGEYLSQDKINSSLKSMFATGLFNDIKVSNEGGKLIIDVLENPIVNKVVFEGNKRISDDILESEVSLKSRSVYTKSKVQNDTQKIQSMYRKSGRFSVTVDPKVVTLDQNRVDIIFEIKEGKKTTVGKINFIGNKVFDDRDLKSKMNTKESRWYSFYSGNDTYDPDKVAFDKELLRKFYISKGYADFRVISHTAEITPDNKHFILNFTVEEGDKYKFGKMDITSALPRLKVEELSETLQTKEGEDFDASKVDDTIEEMTNLLNDMGYAFVDIDAKYDRNPDTDIINLAYNIKEGPKVYINRININGNVRTHDKVIRREFRLAEGDPFNAAKIRRSKQRIENLGFFDRIEIERARTSEPDKADINVEVSEKSTGELSFGAGFSTHDGALGNISLQERNLLGRGQQLSTSIQKSQTGLSLELGFTEPYFLDKDLAAGFDVWNFSSDRIDDEVSSTDSTGFSLRGSYSLTEHLRHTIRYTIKQDRVTNIRSDASPIVVSQAGETLASIIGHSFLYDKRDNRFNPKEGYFILFDQKVAGAGGDLNYLRHEAKVGYYYPIYEDDFILKLNVSGGHIAGFGGKSIRYADNFRLTGRTIRGFETVGFGPTDFTNSTEGTVLGGKRYYAVKSQLDFPIAYVPDELGFTGFVFNDMGGITGLDDADNPAIVDRDTLHASAGLGFSWISPLGPLNVSYGVPYLKESRDRTQRLQFDFGTRF